MNKFLMIIFIFLLAACQSGGELRVEDPWARAASAGGTSAAFFTIDNPGGADRLLSVTSDVADAVEIHQTMMEGDIMRMEMQASVDVPTGKLEFQPGSLHVMLINLRQNLNPGDEFPLTLTFENGSPIVLTVEVRQP